MDQARIQCAKVAAEAGKRLFLPHTHTRSDIVGALRLASISAFNYERNGIKPVVIIVSDLLHDISPGLEKEHIHTTAFPDATELIIIGASPKVDLKALFGPIQIRQLPSFQHLNINLYSYESSR